MEALGSGPEHSHGQVSSAELYLCRVVASFDLPVITLDCIPADVCLQKKLNSCIVSIESIISASGLSKAELHSPMVSISGAVSASITGAECRIGQTNKNARLRRLHQCALEFTTCNE